MKSNGQQNNGQKNWRTDPEALSELVAVAGQRAVKAAIAEHHHAGNPVAIWQDGRVMMLHPDGSIRPPADKPAPLPQDASFGP